MSDKMCTQWSALDLNAFETKVCPWKFNWNYFPRSHLFVNFYGGQVHWPSCSVILGWVWTVKRYRDRLNRSSVWRPKCLTHTHKRTVNSVVKTYSRIKLYLTPCLVLLEAKTTHLYFDQYTLQIQVLKILTFWDRWICRVYQSFTWKKMRTRLFVLPLSYSLWPPVLWRLCLSIHLLNESRLRTNGKDTWPQRQRGVESKGGEALLRVYFSSLFIENSLCSFCLCSYCAVSRSVSIGHDLPGDVTHTAIDWKNAASQRPLNLGLF